MTLEHLDDAEPFHPTIDLRHAVERRATSIRRRRRRSTVAATSVLTALVLIIGATAAYGWRQTSRIERVDVADSLTPDAGLGQPFTVLAAGVDSSDPSLGAVDDGRTLGALHSDTLLLIRVDPQANRLSLISVPRDLWVASPGGSEGRINRVLALGGPSLLIDTVEETFGIEVNHFVQIDMQGIRDLADEVGGLDIEVSAPARDRHSGLDLAAGCQRLDGDQVLALVRSRYFEVQNADGIWRSDPMSDLSRMARQRIVLLAALQELQGQSLDPLGIDQLAGVIGANVLLDDDFSLAQVGATVAWLRSVPLDAVTQGSVPVRGADIGGASVLLPLDGTETYVRDLLVGADPTASPSVSAPSSEGPGSVDGEQGAGAGTGLEVPAQDWAFTVRSCR